MDGSADSDYKLMVSGKAVEHRQDEGRIKEIPQISELTFYGGFIFQVVVIAAGFVVQAIISVAIVVSSAFVPFSGMLIAVPFFFPYLLALVGFCGLPPLVQGIGLVIDVREGFKKLQGLRIMSIVISVVCILFALISCIIVFAIAGAIATVLLFIYVLSISLASSGS